MARDTRSASETGNELDDSVFNKSLNGEKGGVHCSSSRKGDTADSNSGSPHSLRLETGNSPSPLRRCDKATGNVFPNSAGNKPVVLALSFSQEKIRKEKDLEQAVVLESEKSEVGVKSIGSKKRKFTGRSFHKLFKNMWRVKTVPDIAETIERPENSCVDESLGGDGSKDLQGILNVGDTLYDNNSLAQNPSAATDSDSIEIVSSTSLASSKYGVAHSDRDEKCVHPKDLDVDGAIEEPDKVSVDSLVVSNSGREPSDGNVLEDCEKGLGRENLALFERFHGDSITGEKGPEATKHAPESEKQSFPVTYISVREKRRVICNSLKNEDGSSGALADEYIFGSSFFERQIAEEDLKDPSYSKERGSSDLLSEKTELEIILEQKLAEGKYNCQTEFGNLLYKVHKKCHRRLKKLRLEQQKTVQEFHEIWEEKQLKLNGDHKLQAAFIRSLHELDSIGTKKLKHLDASFEKNIYDHHLQREFELKKLEAEQLAALNEEKERVAHWLAEAKVCFPEPSQVLENQTPVTEMTLPSASECGESKS